MNHTITVTGYGVAAAVPDTAVVRLAALSRANTLGEAVRAVNTSSTLIVKCAQDFVVETKIASQGFSVWPAYDHQGQPAGFEARHPLTILCPSLEVAGDLLTAMVNQVATGFVVDSVSLEVSAPEAHLSQARVAAFANAQTKAEQLAGLATATLGAVISVIEGTGTVAPVSAPTAGAELMAKADAGFSPGESSLSQSVTVTWELVQI
jgi:uncharacterized protein